MNTAMKFTSLVAMALSIAACATPFQESRRWVEEVKLADGRIINVEREEFLGRDIPLVERHARRFKTETGKQIRWESCAQPMALDIVEGRYFVIGYADFRFCRAQLDLPRGSGQGGAAAWALAPSTNSRIQNKEVPRSMTPNMVYAGSAAAKARYVGYATKRAELRTFLAIPWCEEVWIPEGDFMKCPKEGGN